MSVVSDLCRCGKSHYSLTLWVEDAVGKTETPGLGKRDLLCTVHQKTSPLLRLCTSDDGREGDCDFRIIVSGKA